MAGIRGKHTKPELMLRSALHRLGLRYRLHSSKLPGRPDIALQKHQAAIEVRGCFWHRHKGCVFCTTPASNASFWKQKFDETVTRDRRNVRALRKLGWRVGVVWECSIKEHGAEAVARRIAVWLHSNEPYADISSKASSKVRRAS
ncbi:very short patch repair endonuclease [Bradyrhizobium ivorense]|uniref:very short patch repair endonuclease n=1 Tax=Bradyrhizobium ivorense TaxID=2511166 RepID=UPI001FCEF409|nr:very short patch repair endonuclease [Bradyrhizobium ivorense]